MRSAKERAVKCLALAVLYLFALTPTSALWADSSGGSSAMRRAQIAFRIEGSNQKFTAVIQEIQNYQSGIVITAQNPNLFVGPIRFAIGARGFSEVNGIDVSISVFVLTKILQEFFFDGTGDWEPVLYIDKPYAKPRIGWDLPQVSVSYVYLKTGLSSPLKISLGAALEWLKTNEPDLFASDDSSFWTENKAKRQKRFLLQYAKFWRTPNGQIIHTPASQLKLGGCNDFFYDPRGRAAR